MTYQPPSSTTPLEPPLKETPLKETPKEQLDHLALRFQKYRLAANLPQETLAKAAGVGIATLRRFESGGNISARALLPLLRELGCPLDPNILIPLKQVPQNSNHPAGSKERQRARRIPRPTGIPTAKAPTPEVPTPEVPTPEVPTPEVLPESPEKNS